MTLSDLLTSPWAILPESLREIQQIYATHLKGEKIDIAAVEARVGRKLANEPQQYTVRDGGIAVLSIDGPIAPKANLFTQISGGASAQLLTRQVEAAMADSRVNGLILAIDSPGGSVFGTPELAAAVRRAGQIKPVATVSEATIASAAYWVGSAANGVYLSGPTVEAGSIGVYARMSLGEAPMGSVEFVRGKYKRASINGAAPSAEYMADFEAKLDHLYAVFVDAVAEHRGVSVDAVLEGMADGRVFIGQRAIDAGLADGFATVDELAERMASKPEQFKARSKKSTAAGAAPTPKPAGARADSANPEPVLLDNHPSHPPEGNSMDRATLEQQHPALFVQLQAELAASGAAAERQRIAAVLAVGDGLPGHEKLLSTLAYDGKTTPEAAALAVLAAEKQSRAAAIAAHTSDAPPAAKPSAAPQDAAPTAAEASAAAAARAVAAFNAANGVKTHA
jgi:capsid assembly protease